jgi:hypothetical protein
MAFQNPQTIPLERCWLYRRPWPWSAVTRIERDSHRIASFCKPGASSDSGQSGTPDHPSRRDLLCQSARHP